MSTIVYLIRHAEAEGNLYRRVQGQYNSGVTERGLRQIAALKKRFESVRVDRVYASDLARARTTAKAVYESKGLELNITPQLRELNMGVWEDKTWGEIEIAQPEQLSYFNKAPHKWIIEDAETHFELESRITNAILDIAAENDGRAVAAISHGMAIRAFMAKVFGYAPEEISKVPHDDNTSVSILSVSGDEITVLQAGDNSHLSQKDSTFFHQNWWKELDMNDSRNVYYVPFDFDREYYSLACRDSAVGDHGRSFEGALSNAGKNDRAVMSAMLGGKRIGMIELDVTKGADRGEGWIELYYIENEHRGCGLSIQLTGHATSVYRAMGRKTLNLKVNSESSHVIGFFKHFGFKQLRNRETGFISLSKSLSVDR